MVRETSSGAPDASTTTQRSGSASAIAANPAWTRAWNVVTGLFEPVELTLAHAFGGDVFGHREQDDEVGPGVVDRPLVDSPHLVDRQAAAVTLVGECRVHRAVAHDVAAGRERRTHDLGQVLGPVGGHDQCLGVIVEIGDVGVVQDLTQPTRRSRCRRSRG